MCGLFGYVVNKPIKRLEQVGHALAIYNENRGSHSWGVYDGEKIIKDIGPIGRNLYHIPFKSEGMIMGHTRAATVGDITKPNAHPFEYDGPEGKVIGAHNGAIHNHRELADKHKDWKLQVDSMYIFKYIAEGLDIGDLHGYGAVTFIKNGRLFLSRFHSGQLAIAQLKPNLGIVWASEDQALRKALDGANLNYYTYNIKEKEIYYYEDGVLFRSKEKMEVGSSSSNFPGRTNYGRGYNHNNNNSSSSSSSSTPSKSSAVNPNMIIRLRIVQTLNMTEDERALENIKEAIHHDTDISICRTYTQRCESCKCDTTRRLKSGIVEKPMCTTCIAKKIQSGELVITKQSEPENTIVTINEPSTEGSDGPKTPLNMES